MNADVSGSVTAGILEVRAFASSVPPSRGKRTEEPTPRFACPTMIATPTRRSLSTGIFLAGCKRLAVYLGLNI